MLMEYIRQARGKGASDLHLKENNNPIIRVNGELCALQKKALDKEAMLGIVETLLNKKQKEELYCTGEVDTALTDLDEGRCRLNVHRTNGRLSLAIRLIDKNIPSLEQLGVPQGFVELKACKQGLLLITGNTGSGKSTTIAAFLEQLNRERALHILTLEDPIEFVHRERLCMFTQREVGLDTASFASGLKGALRQDPDVIVVGELRDAETMSIALTAAETGHLVLATLHTRGAVATIARILDSFPEEPQIKSLLAEVLVGVLSQRLMLRRGKQGRVAAFELLLMNDALKNLIREGKLHQLSSFLQMGTKQGMVTMEESVKILKEQGIIAGNTE